MPLRSWARAVMAAVDMDIKDMEEDMDSKATGVDMATKAIHRRVMEADMAEVSFVFLLS